MYVIEFGDVWFKSREPSLLSNGLTRVCGAYDNLAIVWIDDFMLKMGSEAAVVAWLERNRSVDIGSGEVMSAIFPVSAATVAEMNYVQENSARVVGLIDRLTAIGEADPSLAARPIYPK